MLVKADETECRGPPQQVWIKATSNQSLHGRPHSDNNGDTGSQVDPSGVGETHVMGTHALQPCKVQVFGSKEGEGYRHLGILCHSSLQILSSYVRLDGKRWWTAIFRSLQRCSIGFKSGLWLGHSRTVMELL